MSNFTLEDIIKAKALLNSIEPMPIPKEIKIISSPLLVKTTEKANKPHKRKRIAKKYLKKYGTTQFEKPSEDMYLIDTSKLLLPFGSSEKILVGHSETIKHYLAKLESV